MDSQRREKLICDLTDLHPPQLTQVKTLAGFPPAYQPGAGASAAEHAAALVNWAENSGPGLAKVAAALECVLNGRPSRDARKRGWTLAVAGAMVLAGVGGYWLPSKPEPPKPEIYRLRVTVLSPERTPVEEAKVWSSFGGEPKRVAGGWQFDIPAASCPPEGAVTVFAAQENELLRGERRVALDSANPVAEIALVKEPIRIGGVVVDEENRGVAGATMVAVEASRPAAPSGEWGSFEVWVTPKMKTNWVRVRAEKEGYAPDEDYFRPGQADAKLKLKRKPGTKGGR
jgi:hypothetical protein